MSTKSIGLCWLEPEKGLDGWTYVNNDTELLPNSEAINIISEMDIFKPKEVEILGNVMVTKHSAKD